LEGIFAPADQNRVAEYSPVAEFIHWAKSVFDRASSAPETGGPEVVVFKPVPQACKEGVSRCGRRAAKA